MRLWRPGQSLAGVVNSADKPDPISLGRLRLPRLMLSRYVRFTNRFTEQAIDLQFPHPSAPFHGRRPWARHYVRTRQATAKRHGLDTRRVAPVVPDAGPRRAPVVITATGSAPGTDRAAAWSRPLPRTRLLPELTADGFCPGSASRSRSDTEGALDRFWLV